MIRDFDLGGATWSADFTDAASSHQRNLEGRLNGARWIASQHCFPVEKKKLKYCPNSLDAWKVRKSHLPKLALQDVSLLIIALFVRLPGG